MHISMECKRVVQFLIYASLLATFCHASIWLEHFCFDSFTPDIPLPVILQLSLSFLDVFSHGQQYAAKGNTSVRSLVTGIGKNAMTAYMSMHLSRLFWHVGTWLGGISYCLLCSFHGRVVHNCAILYMYIAHSCRGSCCVHVLFVRAEVLLAAIVRILRWDKYFQITHSGCSHLLFCT